MGFFVAWDFSKCYSRTIDNAPGGNDMNKRQFYALAEKHDIVVEYEVMRGHFIWLQVWAPCGKVFASSGTHVDASMANCINDDITAANWSQAGKVLQYIISHGFNDCPDGDDCDVCHPEHAAT